MKKSVKVTVNGEQYVCDCCGEKIGEPGYDNREEFPTDAGRITLRVGGFNRGCEIELGEVCAPCVTFLRTRRQEFRDLLRKLYEPHRGYESAGAR